MTTEQTALFAIFGTVFVLLVWGRIRYDLVAFTELLVAVSAGRACRANRCSDTGCDL